MLRLNPARLDTQAFGSDLALYSRLKLKLEQEEDPVICSNWYKSIEIKYKSNNVKRSFYLRNEMRAISSG